MTQYIAGTDVIFVFDNMTAFGETESGVQGQTVTIDTTCREGGDSRRLKASYKTAGINLTAFCDLTSFAYLWEKWKTGAEVRLRWYDRKAGKVVIFGKGIILQMTLNGEVSEIANFSASIRYNGIPELLPSLIGDYNNDYNNDYFNLYP